MNQISDDNTSFFCIRPRLIKIGDSKPALEFLIKAKPDQWEKNIKSEMQMTERESKYKEFWTEFVDLNKTKNPNMISNRIPKINAFVFSSNVIGVKYAWRFSINKEFRITLWIDTGEKERNDEIFDNIYAAKNEIEEQIGKKLSYFKKENTKLTAVNLISEIKADIMQLSNNDKENLIKWSMEWMPKFKNAINPYLK